MKIKKILALLMVVTAFSTVFTGCSDEEKEEKKSASNSSAEESYESEDDSSSDNDSSGSIFNNSSNENEDTLAEQLFNSESAYVDLWQGKFFSQVGYYRSDGNQYEHWRDEDEYRTDDVDLKFFNEIGLLYFNNGEFEQYTRDLDCVDEYHGFYVVGRDNYKGSYDVGDNDQLILEYQQQEHIVYDETTREQITTYYDLDNSDVMVSANGGQYLLGIWGLFHTFDIYYGYADHTYNTDGELMHFGFGDCYYDDYFYEAETYGHPNVYRYKNIYTQFYFKNNYIVTEQYGYSFKNYVSRSEFTLECAMEQYASYDATEIIGTNHLTIRLIIPVSAQMPILGKRLIQVHRNFTTIIF